MHQLWIIFLMFLFAPTSISHCTRKLDSADWYICNNIAPEKLQQDIRIAHRYSFFTKLNITNVNLQILNDQLFVDIVQVYEISIVGCNVTKILPNTFNSKLDLRHLQIVDNNIEVIRENVFHGNNLLTVNLTSNNIKSVTGVCNSARYIQEIYLANNNLSKVESHQFYCSKLRVLDLRNNSIEFISPDAFRELHALYNLDLSCNKLKSIKFSFSYDPNSNANDLWNIILMPNNQVSINASNNEIIELNFDYVTKNMPNLKQLYLDHNQINNIISTSSLENKLDELSLHSNNISKVTNSTFKSCSSYISYLDLSRNPLDSIEPNAFSFMNLIHLNLSESLNRINFTNLQLFEKKCNIKSLQMNNCNITTLKTNTFKSCHSLTHLNLMENIITTVEAESFAGLYSLINLKPQNFIRNITSLKYKQFSGLILIEELNLSNLGIKSLENNTFYNMTHLKLINLSNNKIENLVSHTFHKLNVEYINLSNSSIKSMEARTFSKLSELSTLILTKNQISEIRADIFDNVKNLQTLNLSFNKILKIGSGTFEFLPNLINLSLDNNNVLMLESYSFYRLLKLQKLDLKNNSIVDIEPHAFEGVSEFIKIDYFNLFSQEILKSRGFEGLHFEFFDSLDYSGSNIKIVESEAFYGLNYLRIVNLENCSITTIYSRAFSNLIVNELNLSNNNITILDNEAFFGLSVQNLSLSNNNIGVLSKLLFSGLTWEKSVLCCQLFWLYLSNSGVTEIEPFAFKSLEKLNYLDLGNNQINNLKMNTFVGLDELITLNLYSNPILTIESCSFLGLSKLKVLRISDTNIPLINSVILDHLPELKEFSLTNNIITVISPYSFKETRKLETLNLSSNTITDLQMGTFLKSKVNVLDLRSCRFRNNTIEIGIFKGLDNLNTLYLQNCSFNSLKSKIFTGLEHLSNLNLEDNNFTELQVDLFEGLNNLSYLSLQNNKIKQISCKSFKGLNNLKAINLAQNQLHSIEVCGFQYFSRLSHLHLEFNRLSSIRVGTFAALDSIRYLNISNNMLKDFNQFVFYNMPKLEYLDISSNTLYTRSFLHIFKFNGTLSHMENLRYVGLMHNEFPCNNLMDFLKFLKKRKIDYKPTDSQYQYNTTNIDGIACTLFR